MPIRYLRFLCVSPAGPSGIRIAFARGKARIRRPDTQPGRVPEIRLTGPDIMFLMNPAFPDDDMRLTIRCEGDGKVWAATRRASRREKTLSAGASGYMSSVLTSRERLSTRRKVRKTLLPDVASRTGKPICACLGSGIMAVGSSECREPYYLPAASQTLRVRLMRA
jgi:hypothetical protein